MDDRPGPRHAALRVAAAGLALALAGSALASCTSPGTGAQRVDPSGTARAPASSSPSRDVNADAEPRLPPVGDAAAFAATLDEACSTLRDPAASSVEVRRAAELEQLAVGTLAAGPPTDRRHVLARLRPTTARTVRSDVAAAVLLRGLNSPQKKLPRWHVVAPRPVGELLRYYRQAQRRTGVPWTYLAAINLVETRMGRIRGDSPAGARGPMQFIPSTWDLYGAGGDINDPHDAILAAARLLADNGAPGDMAGALWHFNPSRSYVGAVTAYARTMQRTPSALRGYWHWRVLYRTTRGTFVLPVGYPGVRPVLVAEPR